MTTERETPYQNFNFEVEIEGEKIMNFFEAVLPQSCTKVVEYRSGNSKENLSIQVPSLATFTPLILSRHFNGSTYLYNWWNETKMGSLEHRNVAIHLYSEDRAERAASWVFYGCFPVCYYFSPLNAEKPDVLTETIELNVHNWVLE